ncbi:MAG: hypothetical protein K5906_00035 [Bacilli bacterium]|nr:hypothetical protein [Bacilli bacterium]
MRRFWAHIILVVTALVMMGASFSSIFTRMQTNLEYTEGREITFRLTNKDDPKGEEEILDANAAKDMADIMKTRLETAGVTAYNIQTYGNDIVKVQFAELDSNQQSNIVGYLGFNGSLALTNIDDDENYTTITQQDDKFLLSGSPAYLDDINNYPTIVIPIDKNNEAFKDLVEKTQAQKEAGKGETTETGETDEDGNAKTTTTTYIYLWYDFDQETDRYSRTVESNDDYDVNIARKIIMKFDIENLYYPDDKENKLSATLKLDSNGDENVTVKEVRNAYDNARFYVNLLNSSALDYRVTQINNEKVLFVPATTESLINKADPHQYIAWSRTFIATLAAIVLVNLLLVVFFKLSTTSIAVSSIGSIFASVGFMIVMNAEFNIAALIAYVAVSIASIASGVLYASKLKEEIYKGRNLKKANSEASKKSLLPIVDIHVALIFIGAFVYIFGGTLMRSFALVSVVGGLSSLVINLLVLRGLMWLVTNNTDFVGKYNLFGVDMDKVINPNEEVKVEPYKGPYADKDLTKHKKPIGIGTCVLFLASVAGLITFGILGNNQPFAQASAAKTSQIYVYSSNELATLDSLSSSLFDNVLVYDSSTDTEGKKLLSYIKESNSYSHTETIEGVETTTYYFEYTLNKALTKDTEALALFIDGGARTDLESVLAIYNSYDSKSTVNVKVSDVYLASKANFAGIISGTAVAIGVLGLYFMLRYRLTRGLMALTAPVITTAISVGLFVLTRIAFPANTAVVIPLVAFFTIVISIFFMNKEREIILDDKSRIITLASREEMMKKANSIAFEPILILAIIVCYIGINFFGFGPTKTSLIFIIFTIATILSTLIVTNQFGPCSHFLYSKFHRVEDGELTHRKGKKRKNKKIQSATHRSSEPEEAVFIGIND